MPWDGDSQAGSSGDSYSQLACVSTGSVTQMGTWEGGSVEVALKGVASRQRRGLGLT